MSYRTHRTRVRFEDNIKFVPATSNDSNYQGPRFPNLQSMFKQNSAQHYDTAGEVTQPIAPMHTENKTINTNLQSMFKQNSAQYYDTAGEVTRTIAPVHTENKTAHTNPVEMAQRHQSKNKEKTANTNPTETTSKNNEDVNSEASDFIKRRYHSLELQKLLSMKAAT